MTFRNEADMREQAAVLSGTSGGTGKGSSDKHGGLMTCSHKARQAIRNGSLGSHCTLKE